MSARPHLDPATWDRLAEAFTDALALAPEARAAFVERCFADDPPARAELNALLTEHERNQPLSIEPWLLSDTPAEDDTGDNGTLPVGTRLGAYRINTLIGRGGMGEVYSGERVDGGYAQDVAVKVLRAGLATAELRRRFAAERRILARLTHPNIVGILDGGTTEDGRPFLVMPFVLGTPITAHCDAGALPLEARLRLFLQVAAAVQYAHAQLVVHRDIKPSNILVTASGEIRLLDFGIAKLLADDDASTGSATRTGLRLLTPEHAAPEQLRGDAVSTATDIYALGVLLYELLAGTRPHRTDGRTMADLERDIMDASPLPPSAVTPAPAWSRRLRGDLDRIVLMALRKEPHRRYPSVGQFADDIERFLRGLPVSAQRDQLSYRIARFVQRNRLAVASASVGIALLLSVSIGTAWQAREAARQRDLAEKERAASETIVQFLTSIFARANPAIVQGGDTLRVAQLLTVGDALADSLTEQPAVQARIWSVLGTMYMARGQMSHAEARLRRAYDRLLSIEGSDSLAVAQTYHELARAVEGRDGRRAALPMFAASVERLRRAGADASDLRVAEREFAERSDDLQLQQQTLERLVAEAGIDSKLDSMGRAATLNALAINRLSAGNTRDAIALFDETLQLLTAMLPPDHPNRLVVAGNLSSALRDYGDYPAAERLARDVLEKRRAEVTRNESAIAAAEERVALIMASRGFLEESEQGLRTSLRLQRAAPTPSTLAVARTTLGLGVVVALRGRLPEGLALLDSAESGFQRAGAAKDALFVNAYRAFLHHSSGQAEAAAAIVRRLEQPYRTAYVNETLKLAMLDDALGMTALAEAHPAAALEHFSRAAERRRSRLPETHLEIAGSDCGRAVALVQLGRTTDASPALRDACLRYARYGLHSRALVQRAAEP